MDGRFSRESKGSSQVGFQQKTVGGGSETTKGLMMKDMLFDDFGFDDSRRSNSGRLTQGWLEEARRLLLATTTSPPPPPPPGRLLGSPRFGAAASSPQSQGRSPPLIMALDRRDPLSRSATRNKAGEGLGDEILSKSSKLSRNKSDTFTPPLPHSPSHSPSSSPSHGYLSSNPNNNNNPHRPRKSRFQAQAQALPLSPPRHPMESSHRRSRSSSKCSLEVIAASVANGTLNRSSLNGFLKRQRASLFRGLANVKVTIVLSGHSNSVASMVAAICHAWLVSYRQREEKGAAAMAVVVPVMNVRRCGMWKLRKAAWLFHHAGLDATALLFSDEVDLEKLMMTGQMKVLVVGQDILCASGEVGSQCTILADNFCEDAYDLLQDPVLKKLLLAGILLDTQNLKASASITKTRDSEAVQLLSARSAPNYRYSLFDQLMQEQKGSSFVEVLNDNYGKPPDEGENGEGNLAHKIGERITTSTSNNEAIMYNPRKNYIDNNGTKTKKNSPKSAKLISQPLRSPPVAEGAETGSSRGKSKFFLAKLFGFASK